MRGGGSRAQHQRGAPPSPQRVSPARSTDFREAGPGVEPHVVVEPGDGGPGRCTRGKGINPGRAPIQGTPSRRPLLREAPTEPRLETIQSHASRHRGCTERRAASSTRCTEKIRKNTRTGRGGERGERLGGGGEALKRSPRMQPSRRRPGALTGGRPRWTLPRGMLQR